MGLTEAIFYKCNENNNNKKKNDIYNFNMTYEYRYGYLSYTLAAHSACDRYARLKKNYNDIRDV